MRRKQSPYRATNDYFSLSANGGIPRERLLETLKKPKAVAHAVSLGRCLMCKATDIDASGLCMVCRAFLSDEEREACRQYYEGV